MTPPKVLGGIEGMAMARQKKLESPITLFAAIEASQHEALRTIAFKERRSMADVVREALERYIQAQSGGKKTAAVRGR
jgi:hypothetical protein